jgi:hypothetical protein
MRHAERLGWVALAALLSGLPGGCILQLQSDTPLWYSALASLFGAAGIGLIALLLGSIALIAARGRINGGLKPALIVTIVSGLFLSFSAIYPLIRNQS